MKKVLVAFLVLAAVAGVGCSIYFGFNYARTNKEKETLVKQNAELQYMVDAIGPVSTVFTVAGNVTCGNVIKEEDLIEQTIPQSSINDSTITDKASVVGKLYKVDIQPGTTLTKDLVMSQEFEDTVYEQDMTFDYIPLGLKVGNYIDIRIVLPYGETFNVITHKRVEAVITETNTIKVWLTAAEQELWKSALKDEALYGEKGLSIYCTKYVEPGIQADTLAFYPVRKEMEAPINLNPNIKNKKICVNSTLRDQIEIMLGNVTQEDGTKAAGGISNEASGINSTRDIYTSDSSNSEKNPNVKEDNDGTLGSENQDLGDLGGMEGVEAITPEDDVNEAAGGLEGNLNEVGDTIDLNKEDADGNTSSVTDGDKTDADGKPVFSDEQPIE